MQISIIQTDVVFGDTEANLRVLADHVKAESAQGSRLVVFPECFLTGYCYQSRDEALQAAQPIDGPAVQKLTQLCREHDCFVVTGTLLREEERLFNAALLVGSEGVIGCYRKTHLPFLGVDRFADFGPEAPAVFEADGVRIGLLICYDGGFPETSRVLTLAGADLILLPTNWPPGAETMAAFACNARAMENAVYFASCDRIGKERGFSFIGMSRICNPAGETIVTADHRDPAVLRAVIDPKVSRQKLVTRVPEQHVIHRLADRRPDLYGSLAAPHGLTRPGRNYGPE